MPNHTIRALQDAGFEAYLVGGCVRDSLLGRPIHDWDITTSAFPEVVLALFGNAAIPTGIEHGTVTIKRPTGPVEVTTYRGDGAYSDGRRPDSVTFGVRLEDDLARRDFTMNAIAWDRTKNTYVDPAQGIKAILHKRIETVGSAAIRFGEDGLRIARMYRFASQLGFRPYVEDEVVDGCVDKLAGVAAERRMQELTKFLLGEHATAVGTFTTVPAMDAWLGITDGPVQPLRWHYLSLRMPDVSVRLAELFVEWTPEAVEALLIRMKFPRAVFTEVPNLMRFVRRFLFAGPGAAERRRLVSAAMEADVNLLKLRDLVGTSWFDFDFVKYTGPNHPPLTKKDLAVTGADFAKAGLRGAQIGLALDRALAAVLRDPKSNVAERLLAVGMKGRA